MQVPENKETNAHSTAPLGCQQQGGVTRLHYLDKPPAGGLLPLSRPQYLDSSIQIPSKTYFFDFPILKMEGVVFTCPPKPKGVAIQGMPCEPPHTNTNPKTTCCHQPNILRRGFNLNLCSHRNISFSTRSFFKKGKKDESSWKKEKERVNDAKKMSQESQSPSE